MQGTIGPIRAHARRRIFRLGSALLLASAAVSAAPARTAVSLPAPTEVVGVRFEAGPTAARPNEILSAVPFVNDPAQPIKVVFVDILGQPVDVGGTVEVSLIDPVGKATLSGTTSQPTANGVAVFDDLRIDTVGPDYRLHAVGRALDLLTFSTQSARFAIAEHGQPCTPGQACIVTGMGPDGLATGTLTIADPAPGTSAMLTFLPAADYPLACTNPDGSPHVPRDPDHVLFVDYVRNDGQPFTDPADEMTVAYRLDRRTLQNETGPNYGVGQLQLCLRSEAPFVDRSGSLVPAGSAGLMPDCTEVTGPPCMAARTAAPRGDRLLTARLPWVDPQMH